MDFKDRYTTHWYVSTGSESIFLLGLADDYPVLLALRDKNTKTGHIVLALGAAYSFITSTHAQFVNVFGVIPGINALLKPSHFVIHRMLIFDPYDASIREYDPDDIIDRLDFMGTVDEVFVKDPYPTTDLRAKR